MLKHLWTSLILHRCSSKHSVSREPSQVANLADDNGVSLSLSVSHDSVISDQTNQIRFDLMSSDLQPDESELLLTIDHPGVYELTLISSSQDKMTLRSTTSIVLTR